MVLTLVFSELQVLLSHLWDKEKEEKREEKGEEKEGKGNRKGMEGKKGEGIKKIGGKRRRRNFNKN